MTLEDVLLKVEAAIPWVTVSMIGHTGDELQLTLAMGRRSLHVSTPLHDLAQLDIVMPTLMMEIEEFCVREGML